MAHWADVLGRVNVTFGAVRGPQEVIHDPQLRVNEIVVPLTGAGDKLTETISSPIQVHGVAKAPARRAPNVGEHNEEILRARLPGERDRCAAREWRGAEVT
jgi:crotonobetainyl-CoA:carnitine CoA-transferase CaiB-like acyl-CoA transferase